MAISRLEKGCFCLDRKTIFVLIFASIAFVALSGCVSPSFCGDTICNTGEGEDPTNCPQDCGVPTCIESEYYEGDVVSNLEGRNNYAGQELSVKLVAITQTSPTASYTARFELYGETGELIDAQTVGSDTDLRDSFLDTGGNLVLGSSVLVREISIEPTTSKGTAVIRVCSPDYPQAICGNGSCEETENFLTCPQDCLVPKCGNNDCEFSETWENCPEDCQASMCTTATYRDGETVSALQGRGDYQGQEMAVKFAAVTQTSSTSQYQAKFELYDQIGSLVDVQTVGAGTNLRDSFLGAGGNYVLDTHVLVKLVAIEPTMSQGLAIIEVCKTETTEFEEMK